MFLTFFVSSSAADPAKAEPENYMEALQEKVSALSEMSWDEMAAAATSRAESAWESAKSSVRYLVGKPVPTIAPTPTNEAETKQEEAKGAWSFVGLFSSLKGSTGGEARSGSSGQAYAEGEVHAELIRVGSSLLE
jgi:hypothetical protein